MLEYDVHVAVADALRLYGVAFFHTPNGTYVRSHKVREMLKKMGLSKGVPDIIIVTPPPVGGFVGAALEIKKKHGRTTPEQRDWLELFASQGWAAGYARGLDECFELLRSWGYLSRKIKN